MRIAILEINVLGCFGEAHVVSGIESDLRLRAKAALAAREWSRLKTACREFSYPILCKKYPFARHICDALQVFQVSR